MEQSVIDKPKEALRCWNDLTNYTDLIRKLNRAEQRIENFKATMYDPKTASYSDMPRASGNGMSRQERMILRLEGMEDNLRKLAGKEGELYERIDNAIQGMKADLGALLSFRYLDGMKWEMVSAELYGDDPDYDDNEARYIKRVFREHRIALAEMERVYDEIYPVIEKAAGQASGDPEA